MEVDANAFNGKLLTILQNIADADFITFDFEMSGIATGNGQSRAGKPTLQRHYEEMKEAAEKYTVVQLGICCVEKVPDKGFYIARPYNLNLSPLEVHQAGLRMDRQFMFSSSACKFLNENHFDFGKVFRSGVPYLSRVEEQIIRDKSAVVTEIADIQLSPGSAEHNFYRYARSIIAPWVKEYIKNRGKEGTDDYVNIGHENGKDLSGLERRVVHQLVRAEFPGFIAESRDRGAFLAVKEIDDTREQRFRAQKLEKLNNGIARQTGARWIIEALTQGNLDAIQAKWFHAQDASQEEIDAVTLSLKKVKEKLAWKRHVIVGHNLFTDLGFLYATFFGPLPPQVTGFGKVINRLFPNVFDTKFLHTEGNVVYGTGRETLKEILYPFKKIHQPLILLDSEHFSYTENSSREHEAGFDSWMTAEVFTKLAMRLYEASGAWGNSGDDLIDVSAVGENVNPTAAGLPTEYLASQMQTVNLRKSSKTTNGKLIGSKVSNIYDLLDQDDPGDMADISESDTSREVSPEKQKKSSSRQWLPGIENPFWDKYKNKLRVNAAEVGVCDLNQPFEGSM